MFIQANIKPLKWESDFFAMNYGMIGLDDPSERVKGEELDQYDLVQAKVPTAHYDAMDALVAAGFSIVEGELELAYSVLAGADAGDYRIAHVADILHLREMAAMSFRFSRFRPPWFSQADNSRFYATWVEKAVRGTFDDVCLLIERHERIVGFVTMRKLTPDLGRIGLAAVHHTMRNHGIGSRLVRLAHHWCHAHGLKTLHVTTQLSNLPAIRLYLRNGGMVTNLSYWLYKKNVGP